jgi:mRNA interferase MazF
VVCPVTSRAKGYPFEVPLPEGTAVAGVVLVDQIRSVDWRSRRARVAAQAPPSVLDEATAKLRSLLVV